MNYLTIAKKVSLSKKPDPGQDRRGVALHDELSDLYLSAVSEVNSTWQPAIGPFIHSGYSELQKKAESACKELDRAWRAVVSGKADVTDFQQALDKWKSLYREQMETFKRHGHTWSASPQEWHFEKTDRGALGRRSDGRRTVYWPTEESP